MIIEEGLACSKVMKGGQKPFCTEDRVARAQSRHSWWHRKGQMSHFLRPELWSSKWSVLLLN